MDETGFQLARGIAFVVVLVLGAVCERRAPHARARPDRRTNLGLWALDAALLGVVCGACACTVARWAAGAGIGLLNATAAPAWMAVPVTALALDATSYAWHRANHRVRFLWRFHQVHHADGHLNVTTALRFHPGELLLSLPLRLAAVALLGAPVAGVAVFEVCFTIANVLEHGNFDPPRRFERALAVVVVTPALHRRHHSVARAELNTNFGTILSVWDRLARTFGPSSARRRFVAGLPGPRRVVRGLGPALAAPFGDR